MLLRICSLVLSSKSLRFLPPLRPGALQADSTARCQRRGTGVASET